MEIQNKKLSDDVFYKERAEVLTQWPTGKDVNLEEAIAYHKAMPEYRNFAKKLSDDKKEIKGGFVLSCLKGRMYNEGYESDKSSDLYRVNAPADSSRMYMVFVDAGVDELMPVHDMEFIADQYGSCKVLGCFVNVPLYVAAAASKEFKDGDALTLKATGYLGGKMTAEKSIDLITCDDGKVVLPKKWTSFDLAALGDVQYIDLDVQSSNHKVPEVFCMDNFVARVRIEY